MSDKLDILYTKDTSNKYVTDIPKHEEGNAGTDLRSSIDWKLMPSETKLIPTSFKMIIPEGYVGLAASRSGLAMKHSVFVLNSPGIIDPNFRGTWGVILHNASRTPFMINRNDRIAQVVFVKFEQPNFIPLSLEDFSSNSSERGENGFGSTGLK